MKGNQRRGRDRYMDACTQQSRQREPSILLVCLWRSWGSCLWCTSIVLH